MKPHTSWWQHLIPLTSLHKVVFDLAGIIPPFPFTRINPFSSWSCLTHALTFGLDGYQSAEGRFPRGYSSRLFWQEKEHELPLETHDRQARGTNRLFGKIR